jgi:hypothetical protein
VTVVRPEDLVPQGDPETVVTLPDGGCIVGLHIKGVLFGSLLGIREDELGRPVSCSIGMAVNTQEDDAA